MLNRRLEALNGGKKLTLASMAKEKKEEAKEAVDVIGLCNLAAAKARQEERDSTKEIIAALKKTIADTEAKVEATEEAKESETKLFEQIKSQLTAQNEESRALIAKLTADISAMKVEDDNEKMDHEIAAGVQKGVIRDLEMKLADVVGRFTQLEKHAKNMAEASKQMPLPLVVTKPIPSFEFTQSRDKNGNMKVIATPIGA